MHTLKHIVLAAIAATMVWAQQASAQVLDLGVVSGNEAAIPITVVPMTYSGAATPETDVAKVIRDDLNRSGQFRSKFDPAVKMNPSRGSEIQFPSWRAMGQDFIVVGRITDAGAGTYSISYELWDVAKQSNMLNLTMTGRSKELRRMSHQIADQIYEKILGIRGAFDTRIAYVTAAGTGQSIQYALVVADSDGVNPQVVVRSREPLLSPAWSPDGRKLAYVSFERGASTIYVQEIASGAREIMASFRGINGAPAFSPDGRRLAMTLSKSGNPEIYVMNLSDKSLKQITNHFGIDTEAVFTPDGQSLVFTSDRAGKPQLYEVSANGGEARRVSFQGDSNARATVSFDGKKIATAQGSGNVYRISMLDRSYAGSPRWLTLSPGRLDESPSFAPNASMLLYANKEGRRGVLYAISADGRVRQPIVSSEGDVREPAWSPYR
jgi:TolB protein